MIKYIATLIGLALISKMSKKEEPSGLSPLNRPTKENNQVDDFIWSNKSFKNYQLPFFANKYNPQDIDKLGFSSQKLEVLQWIRTYTPIALRGLQAAIIHHESNFNPLAVNNNKNGTKDRGLGQINDVSAKFEGFKNKVVDLNTLFDVNTHLKLMTEMLIIFNDKYGKGTIAPILRRYAGALQFFVPDKDYATTLRRVGEYQDLLS